MLVKQLVALETEIHREEQESYSPKGKSNSKLFF